MNGLADSPIGAAPTDIAVHGGVDIGIRRMRRAGQEGNRRHHLSGLAVSTLHDIQAPPRRSDSVAYPVVCAFYGRDLCIAD